MAHKLLNVTMKDGTRNFGDLPQTASWYELRDTIAKLDGARITNFLRDHITEAWIDFTYAQYKFSINDQMGDYWFFVEKPSCPDHILTAVLDHCEELLGSDVV